MFFQFFRLKKFTINKLLSGDIPSFIRMYNGAV